MRITRVLDRAPVADLAAHVADGGGRGLATARELEPTEVIALVSAAGLRGRGGAGFPTGTKWTTVAEFATTSLPATVVVNAAEGEPGSFKDRTLLRTNPYRVIEGALIAAHATGADRVVIGTKESFTVEREILARAIEEVRAAGWVEGIELAVVAGPGRYLLGEETAMLEVIDGRPPFPRLAPPFRHGLDDDAARTSSPAETAMAAADEASPTPPTLVNNVETLAHVAWILAEGPDRFREVGTDDSPGTVVVTVTGDVRHPGVAELALGTPLAEAIEEVAGGTERPVAMVLSGVSHPIMTPAALAVPLTHVDLAAAGGGLGATGYIVFDERRDPVSVAQAVSRFLAVESCGQCTPCKNDGVALATELETLRRGGGDDRTLVAIADRAATVADGARCSLARQHEAIVESLLANFSDAVAARVAADGTEAEPVLVTPLIDIVDGVVVLDEASSDIGPDWTAEMEWSGEAPSDRIDVRADQRP
ncbi:MAG TPA: NADH-ubiquinone oxidoreductase-F iron-sulfur binding region domain-containing protein [Acidimicrobiales bacterium]|nr:NADH-ubiquinone oxidoreductase-F iron-sulfur binding region domain-containing protein [Acidimicrobiales bacterium]